MLMESYQVLDKLRMPHGLYLASPSNDYSFVWIRDSVYMALPYLDKSGDTYERTCHRLLDLFQEYEWKITIHTQKRPVEWFEFIHSRYSADEVKELPQEWGHAQHDAIGAFLYMIGKGQSRGKAVLRDEADRVIVRKLVDYLITCEFWHDPDNGMWEENREVHMSSVGACLGGILVVAGLVEMPWDAIAKAANTLGELGTRESVTKEVDLAQLSLIYPYAVLPRSTAQRIVELVEQKLLRTRGVARYEGDSYFSTIERRDQPRETYLGHEAEWTFGLPWLALCHLWLGNRKEALKYICWTEIVMTSPGVLPELYYAGTERYNHNTPLGWASSMYILAKEKYDDQYGMVRVNG